jgi:hypothetical protein
MPALRLVQFRTPAALLERKDDWNCLWRRSEVTIPTVQAEHVHQWQRQFGPRRAFRALAVEESGRLLAAMPLVSDRLAGVMPCGTLTSNHWTPAGELLLDEQCDWPAALDVLVRGLARLPWQLFWFDLTVLDAPRWQAFAADCERAGLGTSAHERFRIPRIATEGNWVDYRATWSANHRRNMTRHRRSLAQEHGEVSLRWLTPAVEEVGPLLRRGWELENRSWKGAAGDSVLRAPGMFSYFCRQAESLASQGQLALAFLDVAGEPAAFQYGWWAKGVYHPFKCGYDESLRAFGPGQLLMHDVLEHLFWDADCRALDAVGPATAATDKWQPDSYPLGRLVVAPRRLLGRALLYAYRHVWPTLRRWRGTSEEAVAPPDQVVDAHH